MIRFYKSLHCAHLHYYYSIFVLFETLKPRITPFLLLAPPPPRPNFQHNDKPLSEKFWPDQKFPKLEKEKITNPLFQILFATWLIINE